VGGGQWRGRGNSGQWTLGTNRMAAFWYSVNLVTELISRNFDFVKFDLFHGIETSRNTKSKMDRGKKVTVPSYTSFYYN
jgi:hypothetical protein